MEQGKSLQEAVREGPLADTVLTTGMTMVVIGFLAILAPLASGLAFSIFFGALLIGAGITELVDALRSGTWQRGLLYGFAGLIALGAGALYIARPVVGLVALSAVFVAYLVFVGAFRIVMAFELPKGAPGKWLGLLSGMLALVLAYIGITQMPNVSAWLIGTFVGASLISAGVARIALARGFRKATDMLRAPSTAQHGARV